MAGHAGHRPALVDRHGGVVPFLVQIAVDVDLDVVAERRVELGLAAQPPRAGEPGNLVPVRVLADRRRIAAVGAQQQRAPGAVTEHDVAAEPRHGAGLADVVRADDLVRMPVLRGVVPGQNARLMVGAERDGGAGLRAPRPGLRVRTQLPAARHLGRAAVVHAFVRRHQRRVGAVARGRGVGQRRVVLQARGAEVGRPLQRAPVILLVNRRGQVFGQAAPDLQLALQIAVRFQCPRQHFSPTHVLGIEGQIPLQHARAPLPVLVHQVGIRLVQGNLFIELGGRRQHRFVQPIRQHDVTLAGLNPRQPELRRAIRRARADLQLGDVMLALGLLLAAQRVTAPRRADSGARGRARARRSGGPSPMLPPRTRTCRRPLRRAPRRARLRRRKATSSGSVRILRAPSPCRRAPAFQSLAFEAPRSCGPRRPAAACSRPGAAPVRGRSTPALSRGRQRQKRPTSLVPNKYGRSSS